MASMDDAAAVAATQHGAIHADQLLDAGVTVEAQRWAVSNGVLRRAAPGVLVFNGAPPTWRQRLMVAVLDAGPGACASHRAAAALLGIADRRATEVVEISTPHTRTARLPGVIVHRHKDLSPDHVMLVDGIPCTGYLRTLVDLGAVENQFVVREAFERALVMRAINPRGAEWILDELGRRGRDGVGVFRWVYEDHLLGLVAPDSIIEPRTMRIFRKYGLPMPEFQYVVREENSLFVARVDFAYSQLKEAFEANGWEHHSTATAVKRDTERRHRTERLGWHTTDFTYWHIVKDEAYVARVVSDVLRARRVA